MNKNELQYQPPRTIPLSHILPQEPLLLMGAGPVPIPTSVAQANSIVINHIGETMSKVIHRLRVMAQYVFQTDSEKIIGISGPSSAAMEMAIANLTQKGDRILIVDNGIFSHRFGEMAERCGANVDYLTLPEATAATYEVIKQKLEENEYHAVTMAQGETSCGIYNDDVPKIGQLCHEKGCLFIVDTVCTLSAMPCQMDQWHIDCLLTGGQKGLAAVSGFSLIAFSKKAWKYIENRTEVPAQWCLDAKKADSFWSQGGYHYTAAVSAVLAMHEALRLICEETLERRFARHSLCSRALQKGIEGMGLELFIRKEEERLATVLAIALPEKVDSKEIRKTMRESFNIEISGSFGLPIIRIGQMGEQCRNYNLFRTLYAMGMSFRLQNYKINLSQGFTEMEKALSSDPLHYLA